MKRLKRTLRTLACAALPAALTAVSFAQDSNKLTLEECINSALRDANHRQRQNLRLDVAAKRVQLSDLAFSPSYSAIAAARGSFGDNLYDPAGGTTGERYNLGLRSEYALYDGGVRNYKLRMAKLGNIDARLLNQAGTEGLVVDTISAFCDLASDERKTSVRNLYLEAALAHLTDAEQRFNLGLVAKPEVDVALSTVETARSDLAFQQAHEKIASMKLSRLIGRKPDDPLPVVAVDTPAGASQDLPTNLGDQVVSHDAGLHIDLNAVETAKEQLKVVRAGYGPKLTAYSAAGLLDRQDTLGSSHYASRPFFTIGIAIQVPLLDRRARGIDEKIQRDEIEMRSLTARDTEMRLREESLETLTTFPAIVQQVKSLQASETAGEDQFRLAEARYKNGVGTQTDVLLAMRDLANTRNMLADAKDVRDRILRTTEIQRGAAHYAEMPLSGRQQ